MLDEENFGYDEENFGYVLMRNVEWFEIYSSDLDGWGLNFYFMVTTVVLILELLWAILVLDTALRSVLVYIDKIWKINKVNNSNVKFWLYRVIKQNDKNISLVSILWMICLIWWKNKRNFDLTGTFYIIWIK